MDIYDQGFFLTIEEGSTMANMAFEIVSPVSRGNKDFLLISVVLKEDVMNLHLAGLLKDLLDKFAMHCQENPNFYLSFRKDIPGSDEKRQEFTSYFTEFFEIAQSAINSVRETEVHYHRSKPIYFDL